MQHIAIFSLLLAPLVMLLALGANHPELDKLLRDGDAALSRRDAQGALVSFIRALELDDNIFALQGLAMCYGHLGRLVQSAEMWTRAAAKQPTSNELKYNAGMAYLHLGRVQQALEYLEACQKFRPALIKLASIYRDVGDSEAVQRQLRAAMALEPGNPDAYSYMGDTYNNLKQFELAIGMYERALKLIDDQQKQQQQGGQPRPPPLTEIITLLKHIGDAYMNAKAPDKAISYYRRALGFSHPRYRLPPYALAGPLVGHFFAAGEIGFWRDMEKDQAQIISLAKQSSLQGSRVSDISPYHMLFLAEPAVALGVAASWSRELVRIERQLQRAPISLPPFSLPGACSRAAFSLGYLSRRFHDYPGTQLMLELFAAHNRTAVCTYSFAYGPDDSSDYRSIVAKSSDFFADVTFNTTHAAAAVIKNTGVQVLFDYDGMHDFNSLGLLAHRPAAVHITWLGFASTTGQGRRRGAAHLDTSNTNPNPNPNPILRKPHGDAIDFLLADRHVLPPDHASPDTVSERLLYLPTYQPQSLLSDERTALDVSAETPAQRAAQRRQLCLNHPPIEAPPSGALEQQALWLCSFNRMGKMTPGLFQTAMDLMRAAPRAYLVMMAESREATRELQVGPSLETFALLAPYPLPANYTNRNTPRPYPAA